MSKNELIILGYINESGTGKSCTQGYTVYDPDGLGCTIAATTGGIGGAGGLYIIEDNTHDCGCQ